MSESQPCPSNKLPLKKAPKVGDLIRVDNRDRAFGSNQSYLMATFKLENGEEFFALLTDAEVDKMRKRAMRNPEDLIAAGRKRRFFWN